MLAQLEQDRRALDRVLSEAQRLALARLLPHPRSGERARAGAQEAGDLASLDSEQRSLLERFLKAEGACRARMHRASALSASELREVVLRDLRHLLNTTAGESAFGALPRAAASVLNYGIPALAGRVYNSESLLELAGQIECAIRRHEPRLRNVRVRPVAAAASGGAASTCPVELTIEGELWGYPVPEHLLVRTILDLDAGRIELAGPEVTS
jgi:type VI secretion system protein ImpF